MELMGIIEQRQMAAIKLLTRMTTGILWEVRALINIIGLTADLYTRSKRRPIIKVRKTPRKMEKCLVRSAIHLNLWPTFELQDLQ